MGFTDTAEPCLPPSGQSCFERETEDKDEDISSRAVLKIGPFINEFIPFHIDIQENIFVCLSALSYHRLVENVDDMVSSGNHGDSVTFRGSVRQHYQKLISPSPLINNPQV